MEYGRREKGKNEKDHDEISFSSAGPVVALGLTRLRTRGKRDAGRGIRNKEAKGGKKPGSNSTK